MATPSNAERAAVRGKPRRVRLETFGGALAAGLRADVQAEASVDTTWPAGPGTRYYDRPDLFATEVLGLVLARHQRRILMAIARKETVVVRAGRRIGKSMLAAVSAIWWFHTRDNAQVLITATAAHQVNRVIWREVRRLYERSWLKKEKRIPLDGQVPIHASTGIQVGFRSLSGFSVKNREAAAGPSGTGIMYIVDEGSGVETEIFETIEGNIAAGECRVFVISNPTQMKAGSSDSFKACMSRPMTTASPKTKTESLSRFRPKT